MRKLGIDYGDVRIGFALSDPTGIIASPLEVLTRFKELSDDFAYIKKLISSHEVDALVIGLPINMDGTEGERAKLTYEFAAALEAETGLAVYFVDERLTSVASEKMLIAANVKTKDRRKIIDKIAAQSILQSYLDNPKKYNKQPPRQ
jgi:putative Holliday junction resolvase